jgi:hypothetical protein
MWINPFGFSTDEAKDVEGKDFESKSIPHTSSRPSSATGMGGESKYESRSYDDNILDEEKEHAVRC